MDLQTPLSKLTGIGTTMASRLARLELTTLEDLIHYYPFRYDDFSAISSALEAQVNQKVTLKGEIWSIKNIYTRSRKVITQAVFNDSTMPITLTWFNQHWLTNQIASGDKLQVSGKLTKYKNKLSMMAPVWEKIESRQTIHTGGLIPVYPETFGVTSKWLRTKISQLLPQVESVITDPLPTQIRGNMLNLPEALGKIHFPENWQEAEKAKDRLSFDELFYIQLATQKVRAQWHQKPSIETFKIDQKKLTSFIKSLPFKLTSAQQRVIEEIVSDLKQTHPMNRLVQGEVGSGKTMVAACIAYLTHLQGLRTLFMAPTEILSFQHYETLKKLLDGHGLTIGIYTGSRKKVGEDHIIVGTHALLSHKLAIKDVGLIIVDEQQRFGVEQRTYLRQRAKVPHFLTMTATPIPRTVALTLYGDLDLSIIDELPKGRQRVLTHVVPAKKRADAYTFITKHVEEGSQVYIITPLIEPSETLQTVKAARDEFERLQKNIFPQFKLGLLHGRLKSKEKEAVINNFRAGKMDILVSTSVVEVGMDIPNATIMVIEGAERFGLAQLHQLRGRVGRGAKQSYCLLFPSQEEAQVVQRLKNLEKTYDGMKLSELDLKIRGSGEIFGKKQSGRFELKLASLTDLTLIEKTKEAASKILSDDPTLDKYPALKGKLQNLAGSVMPD